MKPFSLLLICFCAIPLHAETFQSMVDGLLKGTVAQITTEELSKELKGQTPPLLLDTRKESEFSVSHLKGALHFGYLLPKHKLLTKIDKSTPIVTYCSVGKRSEDIGLTLRKKGFTNVKNLRGGIFQWANEKRPIYDLKKVSTVSVHPYNNNWGKWLLRHVNKKKWGGQPFLPSYFIL